MKQNWKFHTHKLLVGFFPPILGKISIYIKTNLSGGWNSVLERGHIKESVTSSRASGKRELTPTAAWPQMESAHLFIFCCFKRRLKRQDAINDERAGGIIFFLFEALRNFHTHRASRRRLGKSTLPVHILAGLTSRAGFSVSRRSSCLAEVHAGDPGTLQ